MENQNPRPTQTPVPRQLPMVLDPIELRGISPPERNVIVVRLARILLEAAGVPTREPDDERR